MAKLKASLLAGSLITLLGAFTGVVGAAVPVYVAPKVAAMPTLSGTGWAAAPGVSLTTNDPVVNALGQVWNDIDPNTVWRVAWDDNALYVLASVKTAHLTIEHDLSQIYLNDAIALFLWDQNDAINYKLFATPAGVGGVGDPLAGWAGMNEAPVNPPTDTTITSAITADGYTIQLGIPWSQLSGSYQPKSGDKLAFSLLVMDANGSSWGQAMWVGHGDTPEQFATLQLGS